MIFHKGGTMQRLKLLYFILVVFTIFLAGCKKTEAVIFEAESSGTITEEPESAKSGEALEEKGETPEKEAGLGTVKSCFVYVCGEVHKPGVYELPTGSRIFEALELAGGVTENGAEDFLNQAEAVKDGQKITVPSLEEAEKGIAFLDSGYDGIEESTFIDLNSADKERLMTLPGIGDSKAESIIQYREEHGAFKNIEELKNITGIKDGVYNKIKDSITVH